MGLQGVTGGNKGLQKLTGGTKGYKGLQGFARDYRGLQGVTGGYNGLQGVTRGLVHGFAQKIKNFVNVLFYVKYTEKKYLVPFSLENKPF